jgi:hypothetical protein
MALMRIGQQRFLSFADEQAQLAELQEIYKREAAWRLEQSHLALARWQAIRAEPCPAPWQDRQIRISLAATSLEKRANAMRGKLRLTARHLCFDFCGW